MFDPFGFPSHESRNFDAETFEFRNFSRGTFSILFLQIINAIDKLLGRLTFSAIYYFHN
jgi:hypothetical protein